MPQELNVTMPSLLDVGPTYTLRVTALDSAGATVTAVKASSVTLTVDQTSVDTSAGGGTALSGDWFLVPGPGA